MADGPDDAQRDNNDHPHGAAAFSRRTFLGSTAVTAGALAFGSHGSATATTASSGSGPIRLTGLTTEYAPAPFGTDIRRPRLSWISTAGGHGASQSAYQVVVATTPDLLDSDVADVWDSGRVESPASVNVEYDGPDLPARTRYYWRVRVWDGDGRGARWSEPAWFETGLLGEGFGDAAWIGAEPQPDDDPPDFGGASWVWSPGSTSEDAPIGPGWFRGRLALPDGLEVTAAHLVVTADDDYTAYLHGTEVLSAPVETDGWKTAESADVSDTVRNAVGADLVLAALATNRGDGDVNPGGLLAKLVVTTAAGETLTLVTDDTWRYAADEEPGWELPEHDDSGWERVEVLAPYGQGPWGDDVGIAVEERPAPMLRRSFDLDAPVTRARLYVSGLAYHDLHLNGARVGDAVLDPGFTDYDETVLYVTHDVTDLLRAGENVLGAELGRGFFGMTTQNVWRWEQAPWHGDPRLLARLVLDHDDGTVTEIVTDGQWRVNEGPTVSNSLYAGESYDARLYPDGWAEPGFDASDWPSASLLPAPGGVVRAQENEPIRVIEDVAPVELTEVAPGSWVADFGRTTAGWCRLRIAAPAGTTIRMLHGETLNDDGTVESSTGNISGRFQLDEYTARGTGDETWEPKFSYKGFRYVQLDGLPDAPSADTVTMRVVHSDVDHIADFDSDQPMYVQMERMMRRTVLNNLHSFPTDTPMYEKNGWTGDVQVGVPSMVGTLGLARFFGKWLDDLRDSMAGNGQVPVIVPTGDWGYEEGAPSPEWTTVYPYLLREMHRWYGDERILADHWEPALTYVDWELNRLEDGLAVTALGDYLPPGYGANPPEDTRLTATAYLHRAVIAMAEVGEMLGHDDATRLRDAADGLRTRLNETFLDTERGLYRTDQDPEYRQTSNAVPLAFGLVPRAHIQAVVDNLVADIEQRDWHLNTGCLGTSVLLPVLTTHGRPDVAAKVALQRTSPSWGHWIDLGADTMWEMWGADTRSRDHYFKGTVVQWLMEHVAGLRTIADGWREIIVRPDARNEVTSASLGVDTVRGRASSSWRRDGRSLRLTVTVPVGSTAEVHVPAESVDDVTAAPSRHVGDVRSESGYVVYTVGAGQWRFTSRSAPQQ